jgi:hypothetical protein
MELVSVVSMQTQYSEHRLELGGLPHPSSMKGTANTSGTMFHFKRPVSG